MANIDSCFAYKITRKILLLFFTKLNPSLLVKFYYILNMDVNSVKYRLLIAFSNYLFTTSFSVTAGIILYKLKKNERTNYLSLEKIIID